MHGSPQDLVHLECVQLCVHFFLQGGHWMEQLSSHWCPQINSCVHISLQLWVKAITNWNEMKRNWNFKWWNLPNVKSSESALSAWARTQMAAFQFNSTWFRTCIQLIQKIRAFWTSRGDCVTACCFKFHLFVAWCLRAYCTTMTLTLVTTCACFFTWARAIDNRWILWALSIHDVLTFWTQFFDCDNTRATLLVIAIVTCFRTFVSTSGNGFLTQFITSSKLICVIRVDDVTIHFAYMSAWHTGAACLWTATWQCKFSEIVSWTDQTRFVFMVLAVNL